MGSRTHSVLSVAAEGTVADVPIVSVMQVRVGDCDSLRTQAKQGSISALCSAFVLFA